MRLLGSSRACRGTRRFGACVSVDKVELLAQLVLRRASGTAAGERRGRSGTEGKTSPGVAKGKGKLGSAPSWLWAQTAFFDPPGGSLDSHFFLLRFQEKK